MKKSLFWERMAWLWILSIPAFAGSFTNYIDRSQFNQVLESPGPIGSVTPNMGAFTSITNFGGYTQTGTAANYFSGNTQFAGIPYPAVAYTQTLGSSASPWETFYGNSVAFGVYALPNYIIGSNTSDLNISSVADGTTEHEINLATPGSTAAGTGNLVRRFNLRGGAAVGLSVINSFESITFPTTTSFTGADANYPGVGSDGINTVIRGGLSLNGIMLFSATAPTIGSGFGTTPSIVNSNGTSTFRVNVGSGGTASSGVLNMPAALTNWNCFVSELGGASTITRMISSTSTSVTVQASAAWASGQVLQFICDGE